jgi:hypothetical protein
MKKSKSSNKWKKRLDLRFDRVLGRLRETERAYLGVRFLGALQQSAVKPQERMERFWVVDLRMYVHLVGEPGGYLLLENGIPLRQRQS